MENKKYTHFSKEEYAGIEDVMSDILSEPGTRLEPSGMWIELATQKLVSVLNKIFNDRKSHAQTQS